MLSLDVMKVRHLMLDRGLNQVRLAERAGLSNGSITNMLAGNGIRIETLGKLAIALGVDPFDILTSGGVTKRGPESPMDRPAICQEIV
jgi:DNA-binding Xre family transcriptional regulator